MLLKTIYRGGVGGEAQAALVNHEFSRIFNKLKYGMHITIESFSTRIDKHQRYGSQHKGAH
jgi:hypothetical protein